MNSVWAILVAGGIGNRFGGQLPKQFLPLAGKRVLDHSLALFRSLPELSGVVLVLPQDFLEEGKKLQAAEGLPLRLASGGLSRQKSVQNGLAILPGEADWIVIHDVARPLVDRAMIHRTLQGAKSSGAAVTSIPVSDTLKKGDGTHHVAKTVSRDQLFQIQTPQAFSRKVLQEALDWAETRGLDATDEAGLVEDMGHRVRLVEGSTFNFKITRPQDLELAEAILEKRRGISVNAGWRIGEGYDVHEFSEGRDLILGGVKIPFEKGLKGHSDADALVHSVCDAVLGAVAAGDLGAHFPDTDPRFKGVSSLVLLEEVSRLAGEKGFVLGNLDATIVCQKPKLAPFIPEMRQNLAKTLKVDLENISVKATTEEGLGFTGTMQGLAAKAVVLMKKEGA